MREYKIEKNIPVPEFRSSSVSKYAFLNLMEVGDSVAVETREECSAIRDAMRYRKMKCASVLDPKSRRFRIWRTG
jgi:hypothetical protein